MHFAGKKKSKKSKSRALDDSLFADLGGPGPSGAGEEGAAEDDLDALPAVKKKSSKKKAADLASAFEALGLGAETAEPPEAGPSSSAAPAPPAAAEKGREGSHLVECYYLTCGFSIWGAGQTYKRVMDSWSCTVYVHAMYEEAPCCGSFGALQVWSAKQWGWKAEDR